jgi:hypothetical protein
MKYGIIGAIVLVLGAIVSRVPDHYREQGREEVRAEAKRATDLEILKRNAEIERLTLKHEKDNQIIVQEYESKLDVLNARYIAAKRDGLRIPKPSCERPDTIAEAKSAAGNNEGESIRLPGRIESGLFDLARKADEVNKQLLACQSWIKLNGFDD